MNRLDTTLAALKEKCSSALACYFTAGDPDFDSCLALLREPTLSNWGFRSVTR